MNDCKDKKDNNRKSAYKKDEYKKKRQKEILALLQPKYFAIIIYANIIINTISII